MLKGIGNMKGVHPVFIPNPIIEKAEKKYILGIDNCAEVIFKELCSQRIHIDGFIDDQNAGMLFYHKPVYTMREFELNREKSILLTHDINEEVFDCHICSKICVINMELYKSKVLIYGAGYMGEKICSILEKEGIEVVGFIDTDPLKWGTQKCGKTVYPNDILKDLSDDQAVIEAGKGCYEIERVIRSINENCRRFQIFDMPFSSNDIWVDRELDYKIAKNPIILLGEYYSHENIKEIILYGNNLLLARKIAEIYKCLDFGPVIFMSDEVRSEEDVSVIEEIVYRDNYLILLYEADEQYSFEKMLELGIDRRYIGKSITSDYWAFPNLYTCNVLLDINLGQTLEMNYKYPGIYVYGDNQGGDYKIAVLGSSTSESKLDTHIRSWVEIMYDRYCDTHITIYNGAIRAYSSSQELTKLTRDMMKLHPDLIIVYDGVIDFWETRQYQYLEELVNFAGKHITSLFHSKIERKKAWTGIPAEEDRIQEWLTNIEYMYAISKSKDVEFFSFMQPLLYTKKNIDSHSRTLLQMTPAPVLLEYARQFRRLGERINETHGYIYNLTDIFDDADVYMDYCHVYENGNEIIAEKVWNTIKDKIMARIATSGI